jgi:hypothetical protein
MTFLFTGINLAQGGLKEIVLTFDLSRIDDTLGDNSTYFDIDQAQLIHVEPLYRNRLGRFSAVMMKLTKLTGEDNKYTGSVFLVHRDSTKDAYTIKGKPVLTPDSKCKNADPESNLSDFILKLDLDWKEGKTSAEISMDPDLTIQSGDRMDVCISNPKRRKRDKDRNENVIQSSPWICRVVFK